jgi:hypothetical protein
LRLLAVKSGSLPDSVVGKIEALSPVSDLDVFLERLVTANALEDVGLGS